MKSHRRCVFQLKDKCKWTTRSSLEQAGVRIEQDVSGSQFHAHTHTHIKRCSIDSVGISVEFEGLYINLGLIYSNLRICPTLLTEIFQ